MAPFSCLFLLITRLSGPLACPLNLAWGVNSSTVSAMAGQAVRATVRGVDLYGNAVNSSTVSNSARLQSILSSSSSTLQNAVPPTASVSSGGGWALETMVTRTGSYSLQVHVLAGTSSQAVLKIVETVKCCFWQMGSLQRTTTRTRSPPLSAPRPPPLWIGLSLRIPPETTKASPMARPGRHAGPGLCVRPLQAVRCGRSMGV